MARIMVIDDVYTIRLKTELVLRQGGHIVQSCSSGSEAVEAVRINAPDLIVLDIVMAGMDGFATLRALRAQGITCPVIAYTSRRERRTGEFKTRGFDAYVPKSESLSGLMAMIRLLLGHASRTNDQNVQRTPSNDSFTAPVPRLRERHLAASGANS